MATDIISVLRFELPGISGCIDLEYLVKVLLIPHLSPVPGGRPYLIGLMNLAGNSVPVIDLALRLKIPRTKKYTLETSVLLCTADTDTIGLIVDKVHGLTTILTQDIQISEERDTAHSLFAGTVIIDNKLTYLINFRNVISTKQKLITYQENSE